MKRFIAIFCIIFSASVQALSGAAQVRVEALYDDYRKRYLAPVSTEKQIEVLSKTQKALTEYKKRPTLSAGARDVISYLEHLFCHTQSLLTGYYCEDNYYPESPLTKNKNEFTLSQIRTLLINEHSKRRVDKGLSTLSKSSELDAIAQNYALELCAVGEITHTLNGSTLEMRFKSGNYNYIWGGENLGLGQESIMELLDQLTTSLYHRENMYQEEFRELGIGQCDNIWVLNYGAR
ncbi:CAP domain-containing protein [Candidatus Gracilibacteria bacterium]|nr:CAP domain-containing protein [Candidatus Gracilibacteria bacterium]